MQGGRVRRRDGELRIVCDVGKPTGERGSGN